MNGALTAKGCGITTAANATSISAWCGLGALLLIVIGVYLLLLNPGVAGWLSVVFWSALLIAVGALLLVTRTSRR
jgi:uncharacterized membrane protein HdeD (DUF308 family)